MSYVNVLTKLGLAGILIAGTAFSQEHYQGRLQDNSEKVEVKRRLNTEDYLDYAITDIAIRDVAESYLEKLIKPEDDKTPPSERETPSRYFMELVENLGKKNVIGVFSYTDHLCLELAMKYEEKPIPDTEAETIANEIIDVQYKLSMNTSLRAVNYENPNLIKTLKNWVKLRSWEFQNLVVRSKFLEIPDVSTKKGREDYVRKLYQESFSRKKMELYDKQQSQIGEKIIESMISTIDGRTAKDVIKRSIVERELRKIREAINKTRREKIEKYFPEN